MCQVIDRVASRSGIRKMWGFVFERLRRVATIALG